MQAFFTFFLALFALGAQAQLTIGGGGLSGGVSLSPEEPLPEVRPSGTGNAGTARFGAGANPVYMGFPYDPNDPTIGTEVIDIGGFSIDPSQMLGCHGLNMDGFLDYYFNEDSAQEIINSVKRYQETSAAKWALTEIYASPLRHIMGRNLELGANFDMNAMIEGCDVGEIKEGLAKKEIEGCVDRRAPPGSSAEERAKAEIGCRERDSKKETPEENAAREADEQELAADQTTTLRNVMAANAMSLGPFIQYFFDDACVGANVKETCVGEDGEPMQKVKAPLTPGTVKAGAEYVATKAFEARLGILAEIEKSLQSPAAVAQFLREFEAVPYTTREQLLQVYYPTPVREDNGKPIFYHWIDEGDDSIFESFADMNRCTATDPLKLDRMLAAYVQERQKKNDYKDIQISKIEEKLKKADEALALEETTKIINPQGEADEEDPLHPTVALLTMGVACFNNHHTGLSYQRVYQGKNLSQDDYNAMLSSALQLTSAGAAEQMYQFFVGGLQGGISIAEMPQITAPPLNASGTQVGSQITVAGGVWAPPVDPAIRHRISSRFGMRFHPVLKVQRLHGGVDVAAPVGSPILAVEKGTIDIRGWVGAFGNLVAINHGGFTTCYAHMSRFGPGLLKGGKIEKGMVVGYVGSTGRSTGPHLHLELTGGNCGRNRRGGQDPLPKFSQYYKNVNGTLVADATKSPAKAGGVLAAVNPPPASPPPPAGGVTVGVPPAAPAAPAAATATAPTEVDNPDINTGKTAAYILETTRLTFEAQLAMLEMERKVREDAMRKLVSRIDQRLKDMRGQ